MALLEEAARQLYREWFVRLRFPGHEHSRIIDGVPEGWDAGTIADFYDTYAGGTPSRKIPDFYTGEINWVKTQELNDNYIFETEEKITEEALARSSGKVVPREHSLGLNLRWHEHWSNWNSGSTLGNKSSLLRFVRERSERRRNLHKPVFSRIP